MVESLPNMSAERLAKAIADLGTAAGLSAEELAALAGAVRAPSAPDGARYAVMHIGPNRAQRRAAASKRQRPARVNPTLAAQLRRRELPGEETK